MKPIKNYFAASGVDEKMNSTLKTLLGDDYHDYMLLHTYFLKQIANNQNWDKDSWIPLSKPIKDKLTGNQRSGKIHIVDLAIQQNLLLRQDYDEHGKYWEGGYYNYANDGTPNTCKHYKLPAHFFKEEKLYTHVPIDTKYLKKVEKKVENFNFVNHSSIKICEIKEFYMKKVAKTMQELVLLDTQTTRDALTIVYEKISKKEISIARIPEKVSLFIENFNTNPLSPASIDSCGHRLQHPCIRIPRKARTEIRHPSDKTEKGEYIQLDIVCSQPFLCSHINEDLIKKLVPECHEAIPIIRKYQNDKSLLYFKNEAKQGRIYETIILLWKEIFGCNIVKQDDGESDEEYKKRLRSNAKLVIFLAFYSNYHIEERSTTTTEDLEYQIISLHLELDYVIDPEVEQELLKKIKNKVNAIFAKNSIKLIREHFEGLYLMFKEIKDLNWEHLLPIEDKTNGRKIKKYRRYINNCILAQRIESSLLFSIVLPALDAAGVEHIITFHDSVAVQKKNFNDRKLKVKKIVKDAFKSVGLNPKISHK